MVAYIQMRGQQRDFSASYDSMQNLQKNTGKRNMKLKEIVPTLVKNTTKYIQNQLIFVKFISLYKRSSCSLRKQNSFKTPLSYRLPHNILI